MNWAKRVLRVASWVGLAVLVVVALVALNIGRVVNFAMTPRASFDAEAPPPPPDYADLASWSALPERADSADRAPTGSPAIDQRHAEVDVFYVHPTSYIAVDGTRPPMTRRSTKPPTGSPRASRHPRSTVAARCTRRGTARPMARRSITPPQMGTEASAWRTKTCGAPLKRSIRGGALVDRSSWPATARAP